MTTRHRIENFWRRYWGMPDIQPKDTTMTDNAERWRNVAQAAQWMAEGREVEVRVRGSLPGSRWLPLRLEDEGSTPALYAYAEYRLKPEPPQPREWELRVGQYGTKALLVQGTKLEHGETIRVREVIE